MPNNSRDSIYRFMDSLCCAVTCDFFSTTHTRTDGHFRFLYNKVTFSVYLTVKKIKNNTHCPPFTVHLSSTVTQLHMAARACGSGGGSVFQFTVQLFYFKRLPQGIERFLSTYEMVVRSFLLIVSRIFT